MHLSDSGGYKNAPLLSLLVTQLFFLLIMIWATRLIGLLALAASLPSSGATDLYVWDPVIEKPNSDTVWTIGKEKTITWYVSAF